MFTVCFGVVLFVTKPVRHRLEQTPHLAASHRRVKYMGQLRLELISNKIVQIFLIQNYINCKLCQFFSKDKRGRL